ncbi:hypothetical protein CBR_g12804 [Chara braunii]|uniref:RNA-directed DNA polymerase n=1 Tax=Chara braunii TaxID=69332 RepID=A0A388KSW4_CHABU|nr:hypothetical protein CBR_g12804 [Chara braunii]|eukprot:GBG73088.1 hypothetical protein CBR_g12804 [Chara braunii]
MGPPSYPASQNQPVAQPPPSQQASQASVAGGGGQGQGGQGNGGRSQGGRGVGGRGRGGNGGGRGGGWNGQGGENQGGQGSQGGGQGYGGPRFDWRNATSWHCGEMGHTIRFCQQRRDDELAGLISSCMGGDIFDRWGTHIDPRTPGGIRQEALKRAATVPPAAPAMFRIWQEREDLGARVEEIVDENEKVTQQLKAGTIKEEPIVIESDDEEEEVRESALTILEKMEDLLAKVGRYQERLRVMCEEAREWELNLPEVMLYGSGPESSSGPQGCPSVATAGAGPKSGMTFRPPTSHGRVPQATQTRGQSKATASQGPSQAPSRAPPRKDPEPERRKEVVEVQEEEDEGDDEEDERLQQEEDRRAEQRAEKRGAQGGAEPSLHDGVPKRKKYALRLEEGFDVERMVDKLLEGHNDLINLKDILASAPRLRGELKGRLSRRLVPNVHLSSILPREIEWTEAGTMMDWKCVACGLVDLKVRDQPSIAMVDTGAKMNIIREQDATMLGLDVDHSDHGVLHGANCKAIFRGTASNVMVEIGRVRARTCFFVMPDVDHPILLGRSFLCRTETLVFNRHEGTMILTLSDPACWNYEIIECRNTGPAVSCRINNENEEGLIIGELGFLSSQERTLMVETMKRRHCVYAFNDDERGRLDVDKIPMIRIHTVPHKPWNLKGARYPNPDEEKKVVDYLDGKMRTYVADYSSGPYASPWFCFIKPNGTLLWVQVLQRLNVVTVRDAGGLPNADALSESCAGRPIISLINLYSGYDQFPVYPPDRSDGLIHMNVAPQGWTNAVATVQRHMIRAMQTVSPYITQPYIDDLVVKGPKEKEEDEVMPGVLGLLEEHNLTASGPKSKHCMREATILSFVCNEKGRRPDVKKTDKILEWSVPFQSITDVRSFLGTCGFWRSFVKDFATKTEHLRKLVRQDQEWVWGKDHERAVEGMKREFKEGGLVLGAPNYEVTDEKPFVVETDAGPTALGGVLIQTDADGKERPLSFESRTLNTTERNYSQFKKETLAVLHCLRTFRNYIFGRRLILREDPTALTCSLKSYTPSDPTIARWLTYIWMFNFELERIPGDKNRADGMIRINWDGAGQESIEDTPPADGFLDQEEDVRLHINEWSLGVPSCVTHPIWLAPRGYEQKEKLVLKPFQEEDPWGSRDVGWMMKLALAGTHSLAEEVRTIEEGPTQIEEHEQLMGGMYLLTNTLLQGNFSQRSAASSEKGELLIPESQGDEFEEGEIREAFRGEEYDGIYRELGLLVSCEIRDRDASAKAQKMRHLYVVRDDHLFIKRQVGNPKRIVCGRNRQIDVIATLHDGIAGGHRGVSATCAKIRESDFSKAVMQRGGRDTRPRQGLQRMAGGGEQHELHRREPTPEFDDDNIELFLDLRRMFGRPQHERHEPRVERRRRSKRPREPAPREAGPTRERRGAPAQREDEPAGPALAEESFPACSLRAVEFRRITSEELRPPSPLPSMQELDIPRVTPFRSLATHLDVSQWEASRLGEGSVEPACYVPLEEPLDPEMETDMQDREEPQDPEMAAERPDPVQPQSREVITVGDDIPPCSPAPEPAQRSWPEGIPEPGSEEIPEFPPEATTIPEQEAEAEDQGLCERARMEAPLDLPSATQVTKSPDIEEPVSAELPSVVSRASEGMEAEASTPGDHGPRVGGTPRETREEKFARVQVRVTESGSSSGGPSSGRAEPMEEAPLDAVEEESGAQESLMAMSTERRGSRLHELAAAMGIGTPQEGPQGLDAPEHAPRLGELRAELGSWATGTNSRGPDSRRQQQQEVMSEPAAMGGSQLSGVCRDEAMMTERAHEEGPRELDTPERGPESAVARGGEGAEVMEPGPRGHVGLPSCHEVTTETVGAPSTSSSQGRKKKTARWHDTSCFWCKEGGHRAVDCPELLEDKAEGRVAEVDGKSYDRQGMIVERAPDGGRAQLYRQNQEELCK